MRKSVWSARVEGGKLKMRDRLEFLEHVRTLDGDVEIELRKPKVYRSSRANRYYFGVIVRMNAAEGAVAPIEMHESMAMHFLRIEDCPILGTPRRKRTPKTDSKEFSDYMEQCMALGAEMWGIEYPEPNSPTAMKLEAEYATGG